MPIVALGLGSLVVAAASYLLGCGSKNEEPLQPDLPKPVDGGGWKPDLGKPDFSVIDGPDDNGPFVRDGARDGDTGASDVAPDSGCVPDPCLLPSGLLVKDWKDLLAGTCVRFEEKATDAGLPKTGTWSGVSVVDYNKDGKPDIYLLRDTGNILYRNDGGTFTDVSLATGLGVSAKSRFAAWGDFDGDGDLDLALVTTGGTDLYENTGVFKISAPGKGIHDPEPGKTAVWLGTNLLIGTINGTRYYKSLGGGSFKEDSVAAGLDDPGDASSLAVMTDSAGRWNVYVANETGKNRYFREKSKGSGTYESIAETTGTVGSGNSTDALWIRIEEEAEPSLYVANYGGILAGGNHLFVDVAGKYEDRAKTLGIADPGNTTRAAFADVVDNKRPFLFLGRWNTGGTDTTQNLFYGPEIDGIGKVTKYIDHAFPLGMATKGKTVGVAPLDYDGDGRIDLVVVMADGVRLFRNVSAKVKLCAGGG